MKITTVSSKELYPIVKPAIEKNIASYKKNIQKFLEARSQYLYDTVPCNRIVFGAEDIDSFFTSIKLPQSQVKECLSHTYYWDMNFNPVAAKDEFTMTMMMIIRYFILKHDNKNAELSAIYLAFSGKFYPSIHSGKFNIAPEKYRHIMEYVVNNILTQKYDLKREGSVLGAVRSICKTWLATYTNKFKEPDDEDIADIIQQLHGRIKSFLGNIASAYYDAYEKRDYYFAYNSDSNDEDSFRVADSDSLIAEKSVENAMVRITSNSVDYRLCKMASDKNVRVDEVKSIIETIQDTPANIPILRELLQIITFEFMAASKTKDIGSIEFISFSIASKPNTKNKNIIRQKEIVEDWLDENSPQYRKRKSRLATKTSYYNSILIYYVLVIQESNK